MLDIRRFLDGLTQVIGRIDFPDANILAAAIELDLSQARIARMKTRDMIISDARLRRNSIGISVTCTLSPRRAIWLLLDKSALHYRDVKDEVFGANQRIQPSKRSAGFGVLFDLNGWTCGYTADSPDDTVKALFCEESNAQNTGASTEQSANDRAEVDENRYDNEAVHAAARPPSGEDRSQQRQISCDELWASDLAICNTLLKDDPYHYNLCIQAMRRRNRECLAGLALSPLLPC
jgi:hypothetical protein